MQKETREVLESLGFSVSEHGSVTRPVTERERELLDGIRRITQEMSAIIEEQRKSSLMLAVHLMRLENAREEGDE